MAENKPPRSTNTMAPWEGIDVGFSPRNAAGAVGGAFNSQVNWSGNNVSAPTSVSPYGGSNSASTWLSSQRAATTSGGASTRPASTPRTASAGPSGLMQAMGAGGIVQRSIQQSLANRTPRRTGWTGAAGTQTMAGVGLTGAGRSTGDNVIRTAAQQKALPMTPNNQRRAAGLNPVVSTAAQQRALPVTPNRQRAANVAAGTQTAAQKASDPLNWAGIARDLGNAGDTRFAKYKTGDIASSAAKQYTRVRNSTSQTQQARNRSQQQASAATSRARPKKGTGRGNNRAV